MSDCHVPMRAYDRPGAKQVTCYQCPVCYKVYWKAEDAEGCCMGHRCPGCGGEIEDWSKRCCDNCWNAREERKEQDLWDAATKIALSEYEGEMLYFCEAYYHSEDEVIEKVAEDDWIDQGCPNDFDDSKYRYPEAFPKMGVYGCKRLPIELNPDDVISLLEESDVAYEDYRVGDKAAQEIADFCKSWNEKHADHAYWPDFSVGIVADKPACQNTDENAAAFADAPTIETAREPMQTPLLELGA